MERLLKWLLLSDAILFRVLLLLLVVVLASVPASGRPNTTIALRLLLTTQKQLLLPLTFLSHLVFRDTFYRQGDTGYVRIFVVIVHVLVAGIVIVVGIGASMVAHSIWCNPVQIFFKVSAVAFYNCTATARALSASTPGIRSAITMDRLGHRYVTGRTATGL